MVLAVAHPRASTSSYLSLQSLANSRSDLPCRLAPRAQGRLAKISSRPRRPERPDLAKSLTPQALRADDLNSLGTTHSNNPTSHKETHSPAGFGPPEIAQRQSPNLTRNNLTQKARFSSWALSVMRGS